jgi:hypothetical protein
MISQIKRAQSSSSSIDPLTLSSIPKTTWPNFPNTPTANNFWLEIQTTNTVYIVTFARRKKKQTRNFIEKLSTKIFLGVSFLLWRENLWNLFHWAVDELWETRRRFGDFLLIGLDSLEIWVGWGEFGDRSWSLRGQVFLIFLDFHLNLSRLHPKTSRLHPKISHKIPQKSNNKLESMRKGGVFSFSAVSFSPLRRFSSFTHNSHTLWLPYVDDASKCVETLATGIGEIEENMRRVSYAKGHRQFTMGF